MPQAIQVSTQLHLQSTLLIAVDTAWSSTVVEEAESLGLVVACVTGICIVSAKPLFIARGWLGAKDGLDVLTQGSGQAEAFERVTTVRNSTFIRSVSRV